MGTFLTSGGLGLLLGVVSWASYHIGYRRGRKAVQLEADMAEMRTERLLRQAGRHTLPREGNAGPARQGQVRMRRAGARRES
jgi:hypothetical protein